MVPYHLRDTLTVGIGLRVDRNWVRLCSEYLLGGGIEGGSVLVRAHVRLEGRFVTERLTTHGAADAERRRGPDTANNNDRC